MLGPAYAGPGVRRATIMGAGIRKPSQEPTLSHHSITNCRHLRCRRYENALQVPVSLHVDDKVLTCPGVG
jgi:hypothetical protein